MVLLIKVMMVRVVSRVLLYSVMNDMVVGGSHGMGMFVGDGALSG